MANEGSQPYRVFLYSDCLLMDVAGMIKPCAIV